MFEEISSNNNDELQDLFERLLCLLNGAHLLRGRIGRMADKVYGVAPADPSPAMQPPQTIIEIILVLQSIMDDAHTELNRFR